MRWGQLSVLLAVTATAGGSGCGGADGHLPTNKPEDALRGFYAASFRDRDFERACRYVTPDFQLRQSDVVGANVNAGDLGLSDPPKRATRPRRGPCPELAARVRSQRGDLYPWSAWAVESVRVGKDGDTAEAITRDGNAGLRVVGDQWRVAWVPDGD